MRRRPVWSSRSGRWPPTSIGAAMNRARSRSCVVGSVAQGRERAGSDVDVYLVVDDERFAEASAAGRFAWVDRWGSTTPARTSTSSSRARPTSRPLPTGADDPTGRRSSARGSPSTGSTGSMTSSAHHAAARRRVGRARPIARRPGAARTAATSSGRPCERDDAFLRRHAGLHLALAAARAALASGGPLMRGPSTSRSSCGPYPPRRIRRAHGIEQSSETRPRSARVAARAHRRVARPASHDRRSSRCRSSSATTSSRGCAARSPPSSGERVAAHVSP